LELKGTFVAMGFSLKNWANG